MTLQLLGILGMLSYFVSLSIELLVGTDRPRPYFGVGFISTMIWWQVHTPTAIFMTIILVIYTCIVLFFYYDNYIRKH